MNPLLLKKRPTAELLILLVVALVLVILSSIDVAIFFAMGFIWNWTAAQDLTPFFENRRYRFSMLKFVFNTQNLILKPFAKAPSFVRSLLKIIPAGLFWYLVIVYNESVMPWWAVFLGSLVFEIVHFDFSSFRSKKESIP